MDNIILSEQVAKLHEPMQKQAEQGLQANNNEYLQIGCLKSIEPTQSLKNQGLAKNFANPLQIGADEGNRTPVISLGSFYSTIELHPHNCYASTVNLSILQVLFFYSTLLCMGIVGVTAVV